MFYPALPLQKLTQLVAISYASEICPVALRAYLTTYVNLCWVIGQFLASAVLKGVSTREDEWAYRIPYALQWMWPIPLIIGITFAPGMFLTITDTLTITNSSRISLVASSQGPYRRRKKCPAPPHFG